MDLTQSVQVASVWTLISRIDELKTLDPDFIIVDEAHHATAGTWRQIIDFYQGVWVLGVTATPCRGDGKGLGIDHGGIFDTLIEGPSIRTLIDQGYLCDYDLYNPPIGIDLSDVKKANGDYVRKQLANAMNRPKITGCAVEHYIRMAKHKPAIAFCVSVDHAEQVAAQFREQGLRSTCIHGKTPEPDREGAIRSLGNGSLDVLTSCDLISEGTDIPIAEVAILLRPTHSLSLYLQQVGRVLRPGENKRALILDHVGNCFKHGWPCDEREWSLDGVKKKTRREVAELLIKIKACPNCFQVNRPATHCAYCGFEFPTDTPELKQIEGELTRLTPEERKALVKKNKQAQAGARTYDDLVQLGIQKGMKNPYGWARHVMNAREAKQQR